MDSVEQIKEKAFGCGFAVHEFQPESGAINCEILYDSQECCLELSRAFENTKLAEVSLAFLSRCDAEEKQFDIDFPAEDELFEHSDLFQSMEIELLPDLVNAMKELLLAAVPAVVLPGRVYSVYTFDVSRNEQNQFHNMTKEQAEEFVGALAGGGYSLLIFPFNSRVFPYVGAVTPFKSATAFFASKYSVFHLSVVVLPV